MITSNITIDFTTAAGIPLVAGAASTVYLTPGGGL